LGYFEFVDPPFDVILAASWGAFGARAGGQGEGSSADSDGGGNMPVAVVARVVGHLQSNAGDWSRAVLRC
tara:strand:- start:611 stop:820 length:210 start_codon:yes stop_codon:yes gene_type:complete